MLEAVREVEHICKPIQPPSEEDLVCAFLLDCFCSLSRMDERIHLGAWRWRFSHCDTFSWFFCDVNFMIKNDCDWSLAISCFLKNSFAWLESGAQRRHSGGEGCQTLRFGWIFDWHMQKSIWTYLVYSTYGSVGPNFRVLNFDHSGFQCINWDICSRTSEPVSGASRQVGKEAIAWILAVAWHRFSGKQPGVFQEQWQKEFLLHVSWWLHRLLISITS